MVPRNAGVFSPEEPQKGVGERALTDAGWISMQGETLSLVEGVKLEIPSLGWRPMTRRMLSPPKLQTIIQRRE
ncbi:MAG: hypothetical protein Ct9H90mP23_1570 [Methanobacteriota archaeon]|nr:MAG: hypothetical protein Ct9H90mP23_1570 [Euryarchaeota archaeon]